MNEEQVKRRIALLNQNISGLSTEAIYKIKSQQYSGAIETLTLIEYFRGEIHGLYLTIRKSDDDKSKGE